MSIKAKALQQAFNLLKAAGVQAYYIFDGAGIMHYENPPDTVEFDVVEGVKQAASKPARGGRSPNFGRFVDSTHYPKILGAMGPGDEWMWRYSDYKFTRHDWKSFCSSLYAKARSMWGAGNFIIEMKKDTITVLRVA